MVWQFLLIFLVEEVISKSCFGFQLSRFETWWNPRTHFWTSDFKIMRHKLAFAGSSVPRTFGQDCKYLKFFKFLASHNILKNAESWQHLFSRCLVEMWTVTHQFITHFTHASMPSTFDSIPRLGMVTSAWELSCMDAMVRDEKKWKLRRQKIKGSFLFSKGQCHERSSKFLCKLC